MNDKLLSYLGLAKRGGKLLIGDTLLASLSKHKIYVIVLASNTSPLSKEKIKNKALYYKIPLIETSTKEELGRALGYHLVSYVGVGDKNLTQAIFDIRKE